MDDTSIAPPAPEGNQEDYTGACCLLVRRQGPRRRRHLRIEVLIDADRLPDVIRFQWVMWEDNVRRGRHYAACMSPLPGMAGWILPLHRYLMDPPKDMVVDHKNRRPGDNRASNLRVCTPQQNSWNSGPMPKKHTKFKGVRRRNSPTAWHRWSASITINGKAQMIGSFSCENYAAYAYNVFARRHFGEFAYLNDVTLDEKDIKLVMCIIQGLERDRERRRQYKDLPPEPPKREMPRVLYGIDLAAIPE